MFPRCQPQELSFLFFSFLSFSFPSLFIYNRNKKKTIFILLYVLDIQYRVLTKKTKKNPNWILKIRENCFSWGRDLLWSILPNILRYKIKNKKSCLCSRVCYRHSKQNNSQSGSMLTEADLTSTNNGEPQQCNAYSDFRKGGPTHLPSIHPSSSTDPSLVWGNSSLYMEAQTSSLQPPSSGSYPRSCGMPRLTRRHGLFSMSFVIPGASSRWNISSGRLPGGSLIRYPSHLIRLISMRSNSSSTLRASHDRASHYTYHRSLTII